MFVTSKDEALESRVLRGIVDDVEQIIGNNATYRKIMAEKDSGRPGHYYGRDVVIEGAMPMAMFLLAEAEFDGDPDWWRDDVKFQKYMKEHPELSWLNG